MNHNQGLENLQESSVLPSALNRRQSDPIPNSTQEQQSGFADQGARVPAIGIPVKCKPNQIQAGIPVFRLNQTSKNPPAPSNWFHWRFDPSKSAAIDSDSESINKSNKCKYDTVLFYTIDSKQLKQFSNHIHGR